MWNDMRCMNNNQLHKYLHGDEFRLSFFELHNGVMSVVISDVR